jgi:serine/threonine protein phosphatase 1
MSQSQNERTSKDHGEQAASATCAIGDLHGEVTLLRQLLEQLAPRAEDTLVFLGDYLDRGEDALATIETLAKLSMTCHCIFLHGNHDEAWLETWNGSAFIRCPHIPGARPIWDQYHGLVPPAIGEFLAGTRLMYEDGYAWYSHAGAQPVIPFWESPQEVYTWGTARFLTSTYDWGKPVIFGHYELEEPLITHTKIGLDTAAWRSGVLNALHVERRTLIQATRASGASTATSRLRE